MKNPLTKLLFLGVSYLLTVTAARSQPDSSLHLIDSNRLGVQYTVSLDKQAATLPILTNFTKALEGLAPGLAVTNGGGQPGSIAQLLTRAATYFGTSNTSLIVLDGFPYYGDMNALNPEDIESVSFQNDAVATSRYGGRGQNGIIDIKTKKGRTDGKLKVNINANAGLATRGLANYKTIDNEKDYYELTWQGLRNHYLGRGYNNEQAGLAASGMLPGDYGIIDMLGGYNSYDVPNDQLINPSTGKLNANAQLKYSDGNWRKAMQRTGLRHQYHVSAADGGSLGAFYLGASYLNEDGYAKGTDFNRFATLFNGELTPFAWLKAGTNLTISSSNQQRFQEGAFFNNPFYSSTLLPIINPIHYYDKEGQREIDPTTGKDKYDRGDISNFPIHSIGERRFAAGTNIIGALDYDEYKINSLNWSFAPYVEATLLKQFAFRTQYNINSWRTNIDRLSSALYNPTPNALPRIDNDVCDQKFANLAQTLTWTKTWKQHNLNAVAGLEWVRIDIDSFGSSKTPVYNTGSYRSIRQDRMFSYFGLLSYNFDEKYFVSANYRKDEGHFWGALGGAGYWSTGLGWKLSNENFLKHSDIINSLMLQFTYGKQQNRDTRTGIFPAARYAPSINIGLDALAFLNRVLLRANYYRKANTNTILIHGPNSLPLFSYLADIQCLNTGVELQLQYQPIKSNKLNWTITTNLSRATNTITKMPNGMDTIYTGGFLLAKGAAVHTFALPKSAGANPENGREQYYYHNNITNKTELTEDYNILVGRDRASLGNTQPDLYGSLINHINLGRFSINFMLSFGIGGKYYDVIYQDLMSTSNAGQNYAVDALNSWSPDNRSSTIPKVDFYNYNQHQSSDRFLKNASYLNIRNLSLAYDLPASKLKRMRLSSANIYVAVDNAFLLSARKGMNPQGSLYGVPNYVYTPARTIFLGLKVGI